MWVSPEECPVANETFPITILCEVDLPLDLKIVARIYPQSSIENTSIVMLIV